MCLMSPIHAVAPYVACACTFRYHGEVVHVARVAPRVVRVHVYGVNPDCIYEYVVHVPHVMSLMHAVAAYVACACAFRYHGDVVHVALRSP